MYETTDIFKIVSILKSTKPRVIGIDGVDGSGKSTLAKLLSRELGCFHLNVDEYIDKNHGQYVNFVNRDAILKQLDEAKDQIIIEGVCLLEVFERLQRRLNTLVYVKRVSDYGHWRDEDVCAVVENIEEFIDKKKEELQKFVLVEAYIEGNNVPNNINFPELAEEIIRYHYRFKPHEKADIIYKRID